MVCFNILPFKLRFIPRLVRDVCCVIMAFSMQSLAKSILLDSLQPMARQSAKTMEANIHMFAVLFHRHPYPDPQFPLEDGGGIGCEIVGFL